MELTQGMELAQVLKLSPGLLQSMEMLQMNTLELGAYLKELALENPVLEEAEPGQGQGQDTWEAFASQVPWLGDTPWTGQTAQEGDWGRGESPDGVLGVFAGGTVGPAGSVARIAGGVPVFGGVAGR